MLWLAMYFKNNNYILYINFQSPSGFPLALSRDLGDTYIARPNMTFVTSSQSSEVIEIEDINNLKIDNIIALFHIDAENRLF